MASTVAVLTAQQPLHMGAPVNVPVNFHSNIEVDIKPTISSRPRKRAASTDGGREDSKKQRGRPRVEPKDATAADRRRTQIRLAQRTYRARKETTISSLEDKVSGLERSLQCMRGGLHDLYQLALGTDLHSSNPSFFDALSKLNRSASTPSDSDSHDDRRPAYSSAAHGYNYDSSSYSGSDHQQQSPPPPQVHPPPMQAQHDGSYDETNGQVNGHAPGSMTAAMPNPAKANSFNGVPMHAGQPTWGYDGYYDSQQPLPPNAVPYGFPAFADQYSNPSSFAPLQQSAPISQPVTHQPSTQQLDRQLVSIGQASIKRELPLPQTYAFNEYSFSRYFHRSCLQYALTVLDSPARYGPMINWIFANTLMHSPIEAIRSRMVKRLRNNADDDLDAPIPYGSPPDVDEEGHWLRPTEIERVLADRGLNIDPRQDTAICETEAVLPDPAAPMSSSQSLQHMQHQPRGPDGQIMVADPTCYGRMPGVYGQMPLPPQDINPQDRGLTHYSGSVPWATVKQRQRLTVDINSLMQFLIQASRCRGRTPAVRRQDLDNAFHSAVIQVVPVC